ncbi:MAG: hypothetical protein L3K02_02665, partial [Thermoplasmata archaeon]|nr:hypothetical protein [Thermoplasmata archaeon]
GAPDLDTGYYLAFVPVLPLVWPYPYLWGFADRPVAVLSTDPTVLETGASVQFDGQALGGNGSISFEYSHLPPGCAGPTQLVFSCRPTGAGTFSVALNVTDAAGLSGNTTAVLHVLPLLSVSVTQSPSILDVGQPWNVSVTPTNGLPSYAVHYSNLPTGCAGTTATLSCRPEAGGVYLFEVTVTDSLGVKAFWNGTVTVHAAPVGVLAFSLAEVEVGEEESVSWNISGGTGPYSVSLTGLPPGCPVPLASPIGCRPSATGSFSITLNATDALGESTNVVTTLTVVPGLAVAHFSAAPSSVSLGASLLLVANLSGGIGAATFAYSDLPPGCTSENTSSLACTPTGTGNWGVRVLATDGRGSTASAELNVTVTPATATPLLWVEGGIVLVGAAAVVVAVLLLVRRRRAADGRSTGP